MPCTPTRSSCRRGPQAGWLASASMTRLTSTGRVIHDGGPARDVSWKLSPACSGCATTKPARASVAASAWSDTALPPVPCDITIRRRMPGVGGASSATLRLKGPMASGASGASVG